MRQYLVIFKQGTDDGWSAYAPDLPGLGVVGENSEDAEQLIREGIQIHIAALIEAGLPVPEPTSRSAEFIAVAA